MARLSEERLIQEIERIAQEAGAASVAVAVHDYETDGSFSYRGREWYHAASTIKVPVLIGVLAAVERGSIDLNSRVHVRNRFIGVADGMSFRVESSRDADGSVHGQIGKTMRVLDLARQMIVTSSNLATNLLIDLVGIDRIQASLAELGCEGVEFRRGVEDEAAFEHDVNNRVTAEGLVQVLRMIEERSLSKRSSGVMLEILHDQEFRSGIPAGVPDSARVANKTGEISTIAHDAALVYPVDRKPYAIAVLSSWDPSSTSGRRDTLAAISRVVYDHLVTEDGDA